MRLIAPTSALADPFLAMVEEDRPVTHGFYGEVDGLTRETFPAYVERLQRQAAPGTEPVPVHTYWLVAGDRPLGVSRLRRHLTPALLQHGGHIGYHIRPSERRKGYGRTILALTLERAKGLGLDRVLVTCDAENAGSRRVIEQNGGVLQDALVSPVSGRRIRRYWIPLAPVDGA